MKLYLIGFCCIIFFVISCFSSNDNGKNEDSIKISTSLEIRQPFDTSLIHWVDGFNSKEKEKIIKWLSATVRAKEKLLGTFTFDMHIYLYRKDKSDEPVPWAHTDRNDEQSVHFYINPEFTFEEFIADWTAPHEISHLTLPFLGEKYSWFAEGYATYMQCQILCEMNMMTVEEVSDKYRNKISAIEENFICDDPFVIVVDSLKKHHNYPAMYWGSVSYFLELDNMLKERDKGSLNELIFDYQKCCRANDNNLHDLIYSLDSLIGLPICSSLIEEFTSQPAKEIFNNLKY